MYIFIAEKLRHKGRGTTTACANYYGRDCIRYFDFKPGYQAKYRRRKIKAKTQLTWDNTTILVSVVRGTTR